ncbi:MAG: hypothetical protein QXF80_06855 [Thermoplasmatales archaeon]
MVEVDIYIEGFENKYVAIITNHRAEKFRVFSGKYDATWDIPLGEELEIQVNSMLFTVSVIPDNYFEYFATDDRVKEITDKADIIHVEVGGDDDEE